MPWKILCIGLSLALVGLVVAHFATRSGLDWSVSALGMGLIVLLVSHWRTLSGSAWLVMAATLVSVALLHRLNTSSLPRFASAVWIAAFGLAPLLQLLVSISTLTDGYPTVVDDAASSGQPTGHLEDLVIVVLDGYPSLSWVASHTTLDPLPLKDDLEARGFTVPWASWSQHTDTALAIPSLMSLTPVISAPPDSWDNRTSLLRLIGGDNYVVDATQSAGFKYTHIESGWHMSRCGMRVDTCVAGPWLDEEVWQLAGPSAVGGILAKYRGSWNVEGALHASAGLHTALTATAVNGEHDLIFAHILLPHPPDLLDASCQLVPTRIADHLADPQTQPRPGSASRAGQLECVNRLINEIAAVVSRNAAIVIAGDHGSDSQRQTADPAHAWTDGEIAERMSAFLAYRLPAECQPPEDVINVQAVRAAVACAVVDHLPDWRSGHFIGIDQEGEWVDPERMQQIRLEAEQTGN